MKKILFFAAAVAAMLTSCNKENNSNESPVKGVKTITASISNSTKVVMGEDDGTETKLNWQEGDNLLLVNVHILSGSSYEYSTSKYSANNSGESATFDFVEGTAISSGDPHFALYPHEKIIFSSPGGVPDFRFSYSDSQTYTTDSFDNSSMPLLAMNGSGSEFKFDAMASVLRLNVKLASEDSDVKVSMVVIESDEKKLSGTSMWNGEYFPEPSYDELGDSITLDCGEGVSINNTDATQFCIVLPPNEYPSGDLTITIKTNKGDIVKTSGRAATFVKGKVYNINVSGDPTPALPAGALPGIFSVSDTKTVHFSQGNLTYNVLTTTWAFYEHQYDCATDYDPNLISLFTWCYGDWSTSPDGTGYKEGDDFTDWGSQIGDGNTWCTLSTEEWQYLFNYGSYQSVIRENKYKWATVNGVNGYVIAPDDFTGTLQELYADDAALAANNLVFLPAAGIRFMCFVENVGTECGYWSSTAHAYEETHAYYLSQSKPDDDTDRNWGFSVRLVTDAN